MKLAETQVCITRPPYIIVNVVDSPHAVHCRLFALIFTWVCLWFCFGLSWLFTWQCCFSASILYRLLPPLPPLQSPPPPRETVAR